MLYIFYGCCRTMKTKPLAYFVHGSSEPSSHLILFLSSLSHVTSALVTLGTTRTCSNTSLYQEPHCLLLPSPKPPASQHSILVMQDL